MLRLFQNFDKLLKMEQFKKLQILTNYCMYALSAVGYLSHRTVGIGRLASLLGASVNIVGLIAHRGRFQAFALEAQGSIPVDRAGIGYRHRLGGRLCDCTRAVNGVATF